MQLTKKLFYQLNSCLAALVIFVGCNAEQSQIATLKIHQPFSAINTKGKVVAVQPGSMTVELIIAKDSKKGRGLIIKQVGGDKKTKLVLPFQVDANFNLYHAQVPAELTKQNISLSVSTVDLDQNGPSTYEVERACSVMVTQHVCIRDRYGLMECNYRQIENKGTKTVSVTSDSSTDQTTIVLKHANGALLATAQFTEYDENASEYTVRSCDAATTAEDIVVDDFTRDFAEERRERERREREERIERELRERERRERLERERQEREERERLAREGVSVTVTNPN